MRVGAILGANQDAVEFLGYGEYVGDEVPPPEINPLLNVGSPNPKIVLDNGDVVWGCECWWGPEEEIKDSIKDKTIVNITIGQARQRAQGQEGEEHEFTA